MSDENNERNLAKLVQRRLSSENHIKVQQEWVEACIQWLHEENKDSNLSQSQIYNLVFEQWLMSDLREISEASLPSHFESKGVSTLKEAYALQINCAFNIGASAYSQLQKIQGKDLEENFPENETKKKPEPGTSNEFRLNAKQSSRMLFFELTDGLQTINGIEYKPLQVFRESVVPGLKVEVKGPVVCRDGIMMLCQNNVRVLGGNAEDLMKECSLPKIFKNILSIGDKDDDNLNEDQKVPPVISDNGQVATITTNEARARENEHSNPGVQNQINSRQVDFQGDEEFGLDDDFVFDENIDVIVPEKSSEKSGNHESRDPLINEQDFYDETDIFDDEIPDNLQERKTTFNEVDFFEEAEIFEDAMPFDVEESEAVVGLHSKGSTIETATRKEKMYIFDFIERSDIKENIIKGYIVTLLSKLDVQKDGYKLNVCIDDGSATAEAKLSNQVLEDLLGFKSSELWDYTSNSRSIPEHMKQAVLQCQQRLASRRWRMNISKERESQLNIVAMEEWTEDL